MLQNIHFNTSSKEISCILSEQLAPHRTDTNCGEVFWVAFQSTHHSLPASKFAYCPKRPTEDAISNTLHSVITHLDQKDTYARILYVDFSSAFNTNIPQKLMKKLLLLSLNTAMCLWIKDFLTERPQSVHVGNNTSNSITLSTGSPQGCVLSPLLFTLLTHDCASRHEGNQIIKFADDTTVVGLICRNDESMYREQV